MDNLSFQTRKLVEKVIHAKCCLETYEQLVSCNEIGSFQRAHSHTLKVNFESLVITLAALLEQKSDFELFSIPMLLEKSTFDESSLPHIREHFPKLKAISANKAISELRDNAKKEHLLSIKQLKSLRDKEIAHLEWTEEVIDGINLDEVRSLLNYCSNVSLFLYQVNIPNSSTQDTVSKRTGYSFVRLFQAAVSK